MANLRSAARLLIGPAAAEEQLAAVGQRDVAAVGLLRAVAREVAVNVDLHARLDRVAGDAAPEQRIRRPALDRPRFHRAVGLLHVHVNPGVRIDPLDLRDGALQLDRLVDVELAGKGMMRRAGHGGGPESKNRNRDKNEPHVSWLLFEDVHRASLRRTARTGTRAAARSFPAGGAARRSPSRDG